MNITFPELALVLLVGPSASGKTTFAKKHFLATEVLSSDHFRAIVCDNAFDQSASTEAFEILHAVIEKRLKRGLLTVVDATNLQAIDREGLRKLAKKFHIFAVLIVFDLDEAICQERNRLRGAQSIPPSVVHSQHLQMKKSLRRLDKERFRYVFTLRHEADVEAVT
ncbi:MAG: polynucleotide kinase-phosphatase, partial [Proteobacteria bacterium]